MAKLMVVLGLILIFAKIHFSDTGVFVEIRCVSQLAI